MIDPTKLPTLPSEYTDSLKADQADRAQAAEKQQEQFEERKVQYPLSKGTK